MALNFGNQGYRRDLNLSETESEAEAINNIGGEGICLLYTSPSPRERTRSRMQTSA